MDFNAAVANNPKWIEAIVDRAVALRGIDELDQAIADITIAITAKPDLHYLYMIRGVFFSQQNQFDQAVSDFSEGLRRWESDSLYFNRGSVYLLQGDRKRAKADFAAALEKHGVLDAWSHADWTYFNRGIACLLDSDVPQAVADFTEAIRINPKLIRAYLNRSTAYHALGKSDEAEADLEHAKQLLREN